MIRLLEYAEFSSGDFTCYNAKDGGIALEGYYGKGKKVVIPAEINGKPVTTINKGCFSGIRSFEEVVFPDTLKHIGEKAFEKCWGLKRITLPKHLEYLGDCAFEGCSALEGSVAIPSGIKFLGDDVFANCRSLQGISFGKGVTEIPDGFCDFCLDLEDLSIPDTVVSIGKDAFSSTAVKEVVFPASLKSIGSQAFAKSKIEDAEWNGKWKEIRSYLHLVDNMSGQFAGTKYEKKLRKEKEEALAELKEKEKA